MKRISTLILISVTLLLTFIFNQKILAQSAVSVPGDFGTELGCSGDWMPDCDTLRLFKTGATTWEKTFLIPAGNWQYKIAYNNSWNENYGMNGVVGGDNIPLSLSSAMLLHFSFSTITHLVTITAPGSPFAVVLAGSFQSELGCSGDWQPDFKASSLTYDIDAKTWYGIFAIPPGNYEFKVTINNSWNENYGQGGVANGPNIPLNVTGSKKILFRYNDVTHIVSTTVVDYNVTLTGNFQSEQGCPGDWQPDCPMTALNLDPGTNLWKNHMHLPPGNWEFKVTMDGSWAVNYGQGGVQNGPNIPLNVTEPSSVSFVYNPQTHIVSYIIKPDIVVLPGNFQTELGCSSDWNPMCDNTRLSFDTQLNMWTGTFDIPAGNWEFKVALDHSWNENYGLYGVRGGLNIPLSVAMPSTIQFNYHPALHTVDIIYKKTVLCVGAFYDANGNGYRDWAENIMMNEAKFSLTDTSNTTFYQDTTGKTCYSNLPVGNYVVNLDYLPARYLSSSGDSQLVNLTSPRTIYFGAVCLGGAGAENLSFWMNKKGKAAFDSSLFWQKDYLLGLLRYFSLVDVKGNDFDPQTYDDLGNWMQQSNSKNMSYRLSTQLAASMLNAVVKNLGSRTIHTPGMNFLGLQKNFMNLSTVGWYVNQQLMSANISTGGDEIRKNLENLVKILDRANNDLSFVQSQPCTSNEVTSTQRRIESSEVVRANAMLWPNPSHSYFNLRPSGDNGNVQVRVMDAHGKLVFSAKGTSSKIYRFGDGFTPGLYFVEVIQNGKHTTTKLLKQ